MPISSGLPQGGVLSPLLWLMFFNEVHDQLHDRRVARGWNVSAFLDLIYADDVTTLIVAPTLGELRAYAWANDVDTKMALKQRTLSVQGSKTHNILLSPSVIPEGRALLMIPLSPDSCDREESRLPRPSCLRPSELET